MLRWIGMVLSGLTLVWMVLNRETLSWSSISSGIALTSAVFVMLYKTEKLLPQPTHEKVEWQLRFEEAQAQSTQTVDHLNRELQKIEQKRIRSEERCLSYQKLVEVHQQEIEKLRYENQALGEQLIQKERKLSEFILAKMEPDLFDTERRQTESLNRELKKQLSEAKTKLKKRTATQQLESRDLLL